MIENSEILKSLKNILKIKRYNKIPNIFVQIHMQIIFLEIIIL